MSLTDVFLRVAHLGAEWVLWLLVALSFVSVAIMIERAIFLRSRRVDAESLGQQLEASLRSRNVEQALKLVSGSRAIECVVLAAGLREIHRGLHAVSEAMLSAKAQERLQWEAHLSILATLGSNAPFIGLLGTVLGIIKASQDLALAQQSQQTASAAVMSGVFEALVATAVGLFVAIPAVIAYNLFQRRVKARIGRTDALAHLLLSMLKVEPGMRPTASKTDAGAPTMPLPPAAAPTRVQQVP